MQVFPPGTFQGPYLGKVIGSTLWDQGQDPPPRKWYYEVELVEYNPDGFPDSVNSFSTTIEIPDPAPPPGTGVSATLLNVFEMANTSTHSMGIAHADLPGTYELQPIPNDTIVPIWAHPNGFITLWPNQFDGDCEETP